MFAFKITELLVYLFLSGYVGSIALLDALISFNFMELANTIIHRKRKRSEVQ